MKLNGLPGLLEKNLSTLKKYQPQLAAYLTDHLEKRGLAAFQKKETKQGVWVSVDSEKPFFQRSKEPVISRNDFEKPLFFIYGAGLPPFLVSCLRALPKEVLGIVVFEPNIDVLLHTLATSSIYLAGPKGARLAFIISDESELLDEALGVSIRPLGLFISSDPGILVHAGEKEAFQEGFERLSEIFRERFAFSLQFLGNTAEDTLLGVRNILLNAPWIWQTPSLALFAEEYQGRPVVWVASGPSLNKNVKLLKEVEDRALIIAAESAAKKLLRNGVTPHIIVALERPWSTYSELLRPLADEFPEQCKSIVLAAQAVLTPQAVGCWPGPVMVLGKFELDLDRWLVSNVIGGDLVYSGTTVAHMGLSLATGLKASCVAFVGQDLAYGEDFVSHASDTASPETMELEAERGKEELFSVPGSLGGEVETHFLWYLFLRMFEGIIPHIGVEVFDCTEGGALIKGTTVMPFAEFISKKVKDEPVMKNLPHAFFLEHKKIFHEKRLAPLLERIDQNCALLSDYEEILDRLEEAVEKVGAAALSPEQRRDLAFRASELLDDYHDRNKALAFIGQSYTFLAGATIAKVRNLNSVEEVVAWQKAFREIHQSHMKVLSFLRNYVENLVSVARFLLSDLTKNPLPSAAFSLSALSRDEGMELLRAIMSMCDRESALSDGDVDAALLLLLARSDPPHQKWPPEYQWFCALFLERYGRNHLAGMLMMAAAEGFSGTEVTVGDIARFWKDFARILSKDDFTYSAPTMHALDALLNAEDYAPDDQEIPAMRRAILESRRSFLANLLDSGVHASVMAAEPWKRRELEANLFLAEGRLSEAMHTVWKMLEEANAEDRVKLWPFFNWLMKTMAKCLEAVDPGIRNTVIHLLDEVAARFISYSRLPISWSRDIVEELSSRGAKVNLLSADNDSGEQ